MIPNSKSPGNFKSRGPVADLEKYVEPEWWRHIFNANYLKTDGDVVEDANITQQEVAMFIDILNPPRDARILDVCCGQGRHVFEFYKAGYQRIEGIDRSAFLVSTARQRSKLNDWQVRFKEGDARNLPYADNSFDIVLILGNSFGYFESMEDDIKVLSSTAKVLRPGGKILLDVADGDFLKKNFNPRSWEWINDTEFVCRERCLSANGKKLISREVITQTENGVVADQFYAENLYDVEELKTIAEVAGFTEVEIVSSLQVQSERNQDMGMMANRIILKARVDK